MATTTGKEFAEMFNKVLEGKVKGTATKIMRKIALDAYTDLINYSQVKTGYLKSNWILYVDIKPPTNETEGIKNASYLVPLPPSMSLIDYKSYAIFANNTSYSGFLEHGTSKMAAQPMVKPTEIRIEATLQALCDLASKEKIK
jgi:hypothetical protein